MMTMDKNGVAFFGHEFMFTDKQIQRLTSEQIVRNPSILENIALAKHTFQMPIPSWIISETIKPDIRFEWDGVPRSKF